VILHLWIHCGFHQINSQTDIASFLKISAAGDESGIKRSAIEQDAAKHLLRYGVHWMVESGGNGMATLET
jgi:hypothetical protein